LRRRQSETGRRHYLQFGERTNERTSFACSSSSTHGRGKYAARSPEADIDDEVTLSAFDLAPDRTFCRVVLIVVPVFIQLSRRLQIFFAQLRLQSGVKLNQLFRQFALVNLKPK